MRTLIFLAIFLVGCGGSSGGSNELSRLFYVQAEAYAAGDIDRAMELAVKTSDLVAELRDEGKLDNASLGRCHRSLDGLDVSDYRATISALRACGKAFEE